MLVRIIINDFYFFTKKKKQSRKVNLMKWIIKWNVTHARMVYLLHPSSQPNVRWFLLFLSISITKLQFFSSYTFRNILSQFFLFLSHSLLKVIAPKAKRKKMFDPSPTNLVIKETLSSLSLTFFCSNKAWSYAIAWLCEIHYYN